MYLVYYTDIYSEKISLMRLASFPETPTPDENSHSKPWNNHLHQSRQSQILYPIKLYSDRVSVHH